MGSRGAGTRTWKLVAVVAVAALLLVPASALGKKKHKKPVKLGPVVTATATGPTVSAFAASSTATAICPAGKQAVSGGYSAPLDPTNAFFVTSSFRSAPDSWTVVAVESTGTGAATAYAYCRKAGIPVTDAVATGTVPDGAAQVGDATASCPAGTKAISGGFQIDVGPPGTGVFAVPASNLAINTTASWMVQAVNNADGAHTITAHAYCMARIAPTYVNAFASPTLAKGDVGTLSSPACPAAKKPKKKGKKRKKTPPKLLSAGGFAGQATVPIEAFSNSRIDSGSWVNSGRNATGPTGAIHLTSQGICF